MEAIFERLVALSIILWFIFLSSTESLVFCTGMNLRVTVLTIVLYWMYAYIYLYLWIYVHCMYVSVGLYLAYKCGVYICECFICINVFFWKAVLKHGSMMPMYNSHYLCQYSFWDVVFQFLFCNGSLDEAKLPSLFF